MVTHTKVTARIREATEKNPYPNLFSPARIGKMRLKNKIIRAANTTLYASPKDGSVTQLLLDHYAVEAAGGVGLCLVEASSTNVNSRLQYGEPNIDSDFAIGGLWNLSETIKMNGAKAGIQLIHAGRQCLVKEAILLPSPKKDGYFQVQPRALKEEEIDGIIEDWADAVVRAKKAGFDCIEFHGAHGYPQLNFSQLKQIIVLIGGVSLENRARFCLEIVRRTRQKSVMIIPYFIK